MHTRESFFRCDELRRESRFLPAATYNLAHTLLSQCGEKALFVPIRSMLYMGILDHEEVIFVDAARSRSTIEIAWQRFRPQERNALDDPVPFEVVSYSMTSPERYRQLQGEFHRALVLLRERRKTAIAGSVVAFGGRGPTR